MEKEGKRGKKREKRWEKGEIGIKRQNISKKREIGGKIGKNREKD